MKHSENFNFLMAKIIQENLVNLALFFVLHEIFENVLKYVWVKNLLLLDIDLWPLHVATNL